MIGFSVDPQNYFQRLPNAVDTLFFNIPIVIWIDVGCVLVLHWVELQEKSHISELAANVKRLRPLLYVLCGISLIILLLAVLYAGNVEPTLVLSIYNGFIGIFLICLMVSFFYYGRKFLKTVEELWETTKSATYPNVH